MSKIELNWITGKRLLERWNIDLSELDICIKSGLPVYNPDFELEEWGPFCVEIPNPDYDPNVFSGHEDYEEKYKINKNNLYDFQVLLEESFSPTVKIFGASDQDLGVTRPNEDQILNSLLFRLEDVEAFEKKHPKKTVIGSQPRKPISLDRLPQDNSQAATGGGKMLKIELPLINATNLMNSSDVS